jgi:hypothetical protein
MRVGVDVKEEVEVGERRGKYRVEGQGEGGRAVT